MTSKEQLISEIKVELDEISIFKEGAALFDLLKEFDSENAVAVLKDKLTWKSSLKSGSLTDEEKEQIIANLLKIGGTKVVDALVEALRYLEPNLRKLVISALEQSDRTLVINMLVKELQSSKASMAFEALATLNWLPSNKGEIKTLVGALNHLEPSLRKLAISALEQSDRTLVINMLVEELQSSKASTAFEALVEVRPNFWTVTIRSRKTERNWEKIEYGTAKKTDIQRRVQV